MMSSEPNNASKIFSVACGCDCNRASTVVGSLYKAARKASRSLHRKPGVLHCSVGSKRAAMRSMTAGRYGDRPRPRVLASSEVSMSAPLLGSDSESYPRSVKVRRTTESSNSTKRVP